MARLTGNGQVTIPKEIRAKRRLKVGDTLICEMEGNSVLLRKAERLDVTWHRAISSGLEEWASPQDDEGFDGL
jgi:AbrB family looped-hinge helix DNA binding protein